MKFAKYLDLSPFDLSLMSLLCHITFVVILSMMQLVQKGTLQALTTKIFFNRRKILRIHCHRYGSYRKGDFLSKNYAVIKFKSYGKIRSVFSSHKALLSFLLCNCMKKMVLNHFNFIYDSGPTQTTQI